MFDYNGAIIEQVRKHGMITRARLCELFRLTYGEATSRMNDIAVAHNDIDWLDDCKDALTVTNDDDYQERIAQYFPPEA